MTDSPFENWRLATIPQVAMNSEVLELLAMAFEGGRQSKQPAIEQLYEMYQQAVRQRDEVLDQQRSMVAAMRGKLQ